MAVAMGVALALGTAWAVTGPFRSHTFWMYFQQDDFFYYLKVARNLAAGHGSTFNGLVSTNGYHPLWLLTLAAVCRFVPTDHGLMIFLALSIWFATMASYALALRLLQRSGATPVLCAPLAAFVAVFCMHLFAECMEVNLTVPLMLALLAMLQAEGWWSAPRRKGFLRSFAVGLVAAAMVLSRLDTAIFLALLACGLATQPELRRRARSAQIAGVALGLTPVPVYLIVNKIFFHLWMPISGMAKELKLDHGFTAQIWKHLDLTGSQIVNIAGIVMTIALLPWLWRKLSPFERAIAPAVLLFPFLYFVLLSWLSDWKVWGWYFYGLRPALCIAILVLLHSRRIQSTLTWTPALVLLTLATLFRIARLQWDQQAPTMADAAVDLQHFSASHPGVYAMGDRSGTVAYLLPFPVVQTEGLMMDSAFLEDIRQQVPVRQALAPFGVRYYVATSFAPYTGCYRAEEPQQAGPHSKKMRDTLCDAPVSTWTHGGVETLVFDLHPKP